MTCAYWSYDNVCTCCWPLVHGYVNRKKKYIRIDKMEAKNGCKSHQPQTWDRSERYGDQIATATPAEIMAKILLESDQCNSSTAIALKHFTIRGTNGWVYMGTENKQEGGVHMHSASLDESQ